MAESRAMTRFREQVIADLAELKTSQKNIIEHLLKLNGAVARHEEAISKMSIEQAKKDEKERITSTQEKFVWGLIGSGVYMILMHFGSIIAPWFK